MSQESQHFENKGVRGTAFRVVIPNLQQYREASVQQLMQLKRQILQKLKQGKTARKKSQFQRGLQYYHIAVERHANGVPHLDILLVYRKPLRIYLTHYDRLYKHGYISTYKKLNEAILNYGKKQDTSALSNLPQQANQLFERRRISTDSYVYLQQKMLEDPLHFNLQQYVATKGLARYVSNWGSVKTKLKDMQVAYANLKLKTKPGFKLITRELIEATLTSEQLVTYDSWDGYATIVERLNQMILKKGSRDPKSLNLLITGAPNTGKSALVWHPAPHGCFNPISKYCSVYPIGMSQWFPKYQSWVYDCIYWNEAKLTSYSYDTILKLLDGSPLDLSNKGSVSRKIDNPLVIMTSNLTLQQLICLKFNYSEDLRRLARANLAVRLTNVVVPPGYDLFLLQKLFVQA